MKICKMRRMSNCLKQLALLHRDREMNKTALKLYAECEVLLILLICPQRFPIDIMGYYPLFKEAGGRTSLLMLLVKVLCELKRALTKGFWRFFPLYLPCRPHCSICQVCASACFISVKSHHNTVREASVSCEPERVLITRVSKLEL